MTLTGDESAALNPLTLMESAREKYLSAGTARGAGAGVTQHSRRNRGYSTGTLATDRLSGGTWFVCWSPGGNARTVSGASER